jgi:hypothetical protein
MTVNMQLLMQTFDFDADDLAHNQRGVLTKAQVKRLRKRAHRTVLGCISIFCVIIFPIVLIIEAINESSGVWIILVPPVLLGLLFATIGRWLYRPGEVKVQHARPTIEQFEGRAFGRTQVVEVLVFGDLRTQDKELVEKGKSVLDFSQAYTVYYVGPDHLLSIVPTSQPQYADSGSPPVAPAQAYPPPQGAQPLPAPRQHTRSRSRSQGGLFGMSGPATAAVVVGVGIVGLCFLLSVFALLVWLFTY